MILPGPDQFTGTETERFLLRKLTGEDAQEIFQLRSSETVNRFIDRKPAQSLADAFDFIKLITRLTSEQKGMYWVICLKDDPRMIGSVLFWNISQGESSVEIGFELLPSWHGKRVMEEILPVVFDFAFNKMFCRIIEGDVRKDNLKSIALLEKFGFTKFRDGTNDYALYRLRKV